VDMQQVHVPFPSGSRTPIDIIPGPELLRALPGGSSIRRGVLSLFVRGSGASLSVNENCDPTVRSDLQQALLRLMPDKIAADPSSAADARALLMSPSLTLPVTNGAISFGTWQGVYFARLRPDAQGELVATLAEAAEDAQADFTFDARQRRSHPIDSEVERAIASSSRGRGNGGLLLVHEKHTSASLSLAGSDLEPAMRKAVPETWNEEFFQHTMEGPDDMPGHVKSTLLGSGIAVPLDEVGKPALGDQQRLMLNEHRDAGGWGGGHARRIQLTRLPGGARVILEAPSEPIVEVTAEVRAALVQALGDVGGGPGLVHIFAPSPVSGVVVGDGTAVRTLAGALSRLTDDVRARAAVAKNGPEVPFDKQGDLLLGEQQGIWLYNAEHMAGKAPGGATPRIVVTVHGARHGPAF